MIRIIIADDHSLLAESLGMMLEMDKEISVCAIAGNGSEAVELCEKKRPDVILMDIWMPVLDGISATLEVKKRDPGIKVIIMTSLEDVKYVYEAFTSGADAYLLKDTSPDKLITLIRAVYWGFNVTSSSVLQLLLDKISYICDSTSENLSNLLKEEELEMIKLISEGKANSEIAEIMCFAEGTVKNKITRIIELTGVENRAQLVMYALKNNMI